MSNNWYLMDVDVVDCVGNSEAINVSFSKEYINTVSLDRIKVIFSYECIPENLVLPSVPNLNGIFIKLRGQRAYTEQFDEDKEDYLALLERNMRDYGSLSSGQKVKLRQVLAENSSLNLQKAIA